MATDINTIIALTATLSSASLASSAAAQKKARLEEARIRVKGKTTQIQTASVLSALIAGEKYDNETDQEREDLDSLEKELKNKKKEILGLLDQKIADASVALSNAQAAEASARHALNAAMAQ